MACGTGKTFTSLKIAEQETNNNGLILFLVPSIALLGQTLNEWVSESEKKICPICICSDPESTKKKVKNENDEETFSTVDLALPASTNVKNIKQQFDYIKATKKDGMTVVFSTYQSIDVISKAQNAINTEKKDSCIFDMIICDEAHRTTGVILNGGQEESAFTKVHDNNIIQAKKRMYMTATPRLYNENAKEKAKESKAILCSMDDVSIYGEEFYRIGFGEAVEKNLLSDYKVLVLTLTEDEVPAKLQEAIANPNLEINTDDATKLVGCINALSKRIITEVNEVEGAKNGITESDPSLMHKAVAFCPNIKASKKVTEIFNVHKDAYYESLSKEDRDKTVTVESDHIDGSMGAGLRDEKLSWLKSTPTDGKDCRILTNVRCLSEGVDVPSLDAVMFLSARNSQVDVVQSVGRVMRRAEGKKYGYIIIPVVIPSDITPEEALDNNEKFKVVWTVLNALRAHDDRFNATVNKIELNKKKDGGGQIFVGTSDTSSSTGTFITRLLQGGYIKPEDLKRKYEKEIHANEIVLLAYYIASINIENTYHDLINAKEGEYQNFEGICLTDTFQMNEYDDMIQLTDVFPKNSKRVEAQKKYPLTVIIGNPPYSVGQKSANDNAQNQKYKKLDSRIAKTYVQNTNATNKNALYDSYIKAFRWASDRLDKTGGIISFVSNAGWLDGNAMDGFRDCLEQEFSSIYVYNLRGNARTSGEQRRKEKGNVFGEGSRTPISITVLVKNPKKQTEKAMIYYHDIGDYLSREEKLKIIEKVGWGERI
jgi:predicted helicase